MPNKNCSRRHFNFLLLSFIENKARFFMWILCLAQDSLKTSSLIFSEKHWNFFLWMSSAAVLIGALRVKHKFCLTEALETDFHVTTVGRAIDMGQKSKKLANQSLLVKISKLSKVKKQQERNDSC